MDDEEFEWYTGTGEEEEDEQRLGLTQYNLSPSGFTEFAMRLPYAGEYKPFTFEGRGYLRQIYDTPTQRRIIMAGRQVEKSTLLGNQILSYCALNAGFRALYVSPSHTQTKVFSRDRISEPIETSNILKGFTNSKLLANVLEKKFVNRSQVTLRFAFLNADRVRGIPADYVLIDEFQDIILENIPVIEECASHSSYKFFTYSGTPKSLDNPLEFYYRRFSTQNEWVVPCRRHGTPKDPKSWHWNLLDEDNIGKESLICDKCKKPIDPADEGACWAAMNPNPAVERPYEGFRIPQLMVPWIEWAEILDKQRKYPRARFYNEVLGLSYDSGVRPLTQGDVKDNCNPKLSMVHYERVAELYKGSTPIFMGIDWGTGENTYTVIVLAAYLPFDEEKFTVFYAHRCEGPESEPKLQLELIRKLVAQFNVAYIGADYGGGHWPNDELLRDFGADRLKKYQWVGRVKKKISYEPGLTVPRYVCHRTEIMSDIFNAIKRRNVFRFPRWKEWNDPYGQDMLNIFSEYNKQLLMNVYKHAHGMPDDTFHALTF
ncbi:MAG: phage terminase large subunit family protein, partial [Planctomycetota bacterium]